MNISLLSRNYRGQKVVGQHIESAQEKLNQESYMQPFSLQKWGQIGTFPEKQKLNSFIASRPTLQKILKEVLWVANNWPQMVIQMHMNKMKSIGNYVIIKHSINAHFLLSFNRPTMTFIIMYEVFLGL